MLKLNLLLNYLFMKKLFIKQDIVGTITGAKEVFTISDVGRASDERKKYIKEEKQTQNWIKKYAI